MKKINFTHAARVARRKITEIKQWESYVDRWQPTRVTDELVATRRSCKLLEDYEKNERRVKAALVNSRRLLADSLRDVKAAETCTPNIKARYTRNFQMYWEQHEKWLREIGMAK